MKIFISSLLLLGSALAKPLPNFFQAKTLDEIRKASQSEKTIEDVLRGRRNLKNRRLETSTHILADRFGGTPGFYHSVASGDPLEDAVVIWTRYTPVTMDEEITLEFRMAAVDADLESDAHLDPAMNSAIKRGLVTVTKETDFIAKIDITGLESNTHYVYAFLTAEENPVISDVGLTRTAPSSVDDAESLTYAFFSCSHFSNGFFHAYDIASSVEDIDLAIFVGDYYYEYGNFDTYAREASALRDDKVLPIWEVIDLQDYRNRHSTYLAYDEGLRNLRRRVPIMAFWDDHETANDSYGTADIIGAMNHQPVCSANATSTNEEKSAAECDRDEGDAVARFEAAAQAYMEWLPLRYAAGSMGQLNIGSITKVIEWGELATIVGVDTRVSYRTSAGGTAFDNPSYGFVAFNETNVTAYSDPSTFAYEILQGAISQDLAERNMGNRSIIGESISVLETAFERSKAEGKPWQIWAGNTMMGHYVLPDPAKLYLDAPEAFQSALKDLWDFILPSEDGLIPRIVSALAQADLEWNLDDYSGFHNERMKIVDLAQTKTNNMIVLGGDLHDGFAWQVPSSGLSEGEPVFVNLGCASVTSPGFGPNFFPFFASIQEAIGGKGAVVDILEKAFLRQNPNLKLVNLDLKGPTIVTVTGTTHTAEYFGVTDEDRLSDYPDARKDSMTANPICKGRVVTRADEPGSLAAFEDCSTTVFATERPAVYNLPVPASNTEDLSALSGCGYIGCSFDASTVVTDAPSAAMEATDAPNTSTTISPVAPADPTAAPNAAAGSSAAAWSEYSFISALMSFLCVVSVM
ncbi:unnamed protein product [Cylindrotheca closterium]|uniref:Alkaline phosphatase n=1 Tax=Cylindrotheca closterium TaxID=2856 RepID=A0AAD2FGF5_9STRA|nr:unnamed protein product [Cylindrotheca closterium]